MRNNCQPTHSSFFQDILCKDCVIFYKLNLKCILWFCIFPLFFLPEIDSLFCSLMHSWNQLGWSILLIKWFCTTQNPNYECHLFVLYILVSFCPFSFGHCIVCPSSPVSTIFQLYLGSQLYWWSKSEYPGKTTNVASHWQTSLRILIIPTIPNIRWYLCAITNCLYIRLIC